MRVQSNQSSDDLQSKRLAISDCVRQCLLPNPIVIQFCDEIDYAFRDRLYNPMITVWMFITQVISPDKSCQNAVTRFNAWRTEQGLAKVSCETTSFCQARRRLPEVLFHKLLAWTASQCEQATQDAWLFGGRVVELVDGWTVTMADTPKNQKAYPQMACQAAGCGFPIARMVGLFSLATGAVNFTAMSAYQGKETGETSLLRTILDRILPGRILLADRYYATFWLLSLSQLQGVDLVARAHHLRKIDFRQGLKQGHWDHIVAYPKPQRPKWMSSAEYDAYPRSILVRHLRYRIGIKGFHTREVTLATTLLDATKYEAHELASLYRRRWLVELHLRSLKTQMTMEHLRCQTPAMVRKEVHCHLIGYNIIRAAMVASALKFQCTPTRLSFTGALQAIAEFAAHLRTCSRRYRTQWECLLRTISQLTVGHRPGRTEPRELKRRPKQYKLLQSPRKPIRTRDATIT